MSAWTDKILKRVVNDYNKNPQTFLRADRRRNIQKLATKYWKEMVLNEFFSKNILPKLPKETVGNPFIFNLDRRISPLTVQHLYHFFTMKVKSGYDIRKSDIILEFGPGFGNLCRLIHVLGFTGKYILIDFPQQLEIQKDFLLKSGIDITNITFIPLDLTLIEEKLQPLKKISLIGTFSISEMPLSDRNHIEKIYHYFNYIFIIYKPKEFDGVDNVKYFEELKSNILKPFKIHDFKDQHYGSRFLIGKKEM